MSEIPAWAGDMGAAGLLAVAILLILTGRLLWHGVADRMLAMKQQEADDWRKAHAEQVERNRILAETLPKIVDGQEVIVKVLDSLPRPEKTT